LTALAVVAQLAGAELDAELASVHRQRSALAAYELGLIERKAALGARQPLPFAPVTRTGSMADLLDEEEALQACDDFLPEEVAVLLGASVPSTRHHVDYALTLVRQLPAVWHALADGRIDESRARAIVKALKHQAASWGGPVDDVVVDALARCGVGWAERGCGPSALHDRLVAALIAADPAAADRRREARKRGADAVVVPAGDGLGELRLLHVDVADLELARAQVNAYARALKADGDERPIGQVRISVILALIMRPWEARDPAVAHVTVNADLADLLLPDLEHLIPDGPTDDELLEDDTADEATDDEASPATPTAGDGDGDGDGDGGAGRDGRPAAEGTGLPGSRGTGLPSGGAQVGDIGGLPVSPAEVEELLRRIDALGLTHPVGGHLAITVTGPHRQLLSVVTPEEIEAAGKADRGLGPPPATHAYRPTAAQYRYLRARDRHCRFPGCRQVFRACDADHVIPYDHRNPAAGGPTCVRNLAMLCRRHHRLKTHAPGWRFVMDADGTLTVTTPGGATRTTRPPAVGEVLDLLAEPAAPPCDPADDPPPF
jgi:hypothetical protein